MSDIVKFVSITSKDRLVIGRVYSDKSIADLIELYTDHNNKFCINFLKGSDIAYKFLPECTELFDILKQGITGVTMADIGKELHKQGYLYR